LQGGRKNEKRSEVTKASSGVGRRKGCKTKREEGESGEREENKKKVCRVPWYHALQFQISGEKNGPIHFSK